MRTLYECSVCREGDCIILRLVGSGFLYNMVRIIAGTLLRVGTGLYSPQKVEEILDDASRKQMREDLAIQKAVDLVREAAVEKITPIAERLPGFQHRKKARAGGDKNEFSTLCH